MSALTAGHLPPPPRASALRASMMGRAPARAHKQSGSWRLETEDSSIPPQLSRSTRSEPRRPQVRPSSMKMPGVIPGHVVSSCLRHRTEAEKFLWIHRRRTWKHRYPPSLMGEFSTSKVSHPSLGFRRHNNAPAKRGLVWPRCWRPPPTADELVPAWFHELRDLYNGASRPPFSSEDMSTSLW